MKKIFAIAIAALFAVSANAQCCKEESKCCGGCFQPTWFINFQGGVQMPYTPGDHLKDLLSPAFSVNFGRNITPLMSARVGVEGWQSKVFNANTGNKEKFKYATASFDAMLNVAHLFCKKSPLDFYVIGGVGLNYSNMATTNSSHYSPNVRLGAQLQYNVSKVVALNLEYRADNTNDQFNGRLESGTHDWYSSLLLGISFKFGKKAVKPAPVVEPVYATRIDTIWYNDTEYKTEKVAEELQRDFHYAIRQSGPVDAGMVSEIANFVKTHEDAKVTVTGYADKGTGNARVNKKYSKQRAEAVADALCEAGVPADIMTVDYVGDTVQPFAENDENRVAITVATGIGEKKTPVTVKKFRTEEVRYQVNQ